MRALTIIGAVALLGAASAAQAQHRQSYSPPPQSSWGVGSWGQPAPDYGRRDHRRDGYGHGYGYRQGYAGASSSYDYRYSQSYSYQAYGYRPSYGYDAYGYRPPVRQGYRRDRYRDCDCGGDVYLYDR